jgi:hypothetical protein
VCPWRKQLLIAPQEIPGTRTLACTSSPSVVGGIAASGEFLFRNEQRMARGHEKGDVKSAPRQIIRTYVPVALHNKGVSKSAVNHAALARYLDDTNHDQAILRKLDRIERNQERGQRDGDFLVEAFAVFVQIWLAHTPRLADADKPSAEQSALQRFREYAEHVAEKVAEGGTFLGHLVRKNVSDGETAASEPTARPRSGAQ